MKKFKIRKLMARELALALVFSTFFMVSKVDANAASYNLMETYGAKYGYSGNCVHTHMLRDSRIVNAIKKDSNIVTLGNEMKPDYLLGSRQATLISVDEAKRLGYYIPSNYKERYVPKIDFRTVDEAVKICYENGLKMRGHTLVWHSQTPTWLFRENYSGNGRFVNTATMDARLEFYVKSVMGHFYSGNYGSTLVYWDVCNETLHAQNSGWEAVYGSNKTNAVYVKKAFNYAYQVLEQYKLTNSVKLFYNDYNTYMEVNDVIKLVNYINQGKKVCAGVGMQSHLGTGFPSVDYYTNALNSFLRAGFEVQITELDITNKGDYDLNNYAYRLFKNINAAKKNGGNISCITWWGPSDAETWIRNEKPLIWSNIGVAKPAYDEVVKAFTETFGNPGSFTPQPTPTPTPSGQNVNTNSTAHIDDGWYYLKNTNSQKYLTVEGDSAKAGANVCIGTGRGLDGQKWYVRNTNDGYITLTSKLGDFMLDVANGSAEDGANIGIYNAYGGDAQKFLLKNTKTNGVYTIATKSSKEVRYIDVYEHKKVEGTNVCQWLYYGNPNQEWVFEKVAEQSVTPQPTPVPTPVPQPADKGLELSYTINNWGSGYQVSYKISNATGNTVNGWTLKVNKNQVNIDSSWNVKVTTSGDYYVITPVDWNASIANGGSIEFGSVGVGQIGNSFDYVLE